MTATAVVALPVCPAGDPRPHRLRPRDHRVALHVAQRREPDRARPAGGQRARQLDPAGHAAVRPGRAVDERDGNRRPDLRPRPGPGRARAGRPRAGQRRRQHAVRRPLGVGDRRQRGPGLDHHPGDDPRRLSAGLRGSPDLEHREHRHHRPPEHHHDHLRLGSRRLGGRAVRRRHHSGNPGGHRPGADGLRHRPLTRLGRRLAVLLEGPRPGDPRGVAGAHHAAHHHRRDRVRGLHADRGRRGGRGVRRRGRLRVPRPEPAYALPGAGRLGGRSPRSS